MGLRPSRMAFIARGTAGLVAALGCATAAGCVLGPYTGQMFSGEPQGATLTFTGLVDNAAPAINGYVLADGNADPHTGSYINITNPVTIDGPYTDGKDPVPYYSWSFKSKPLNETEWPRGGLARFKVTGKFNGSATPGDLYVFDNEGMSCLGSPEEAAKGWRQRGVDCRSPYLNAKLITAVSTVTTPADEHGDIKYLGKGGGHAYLPSQDPLEQLEETDNYYQKIGAPSTLSQFKSTYGFPTGEIHAIYYNVGDLGIARDMHCKKTAGASPITACYVTNYGRSTKITSDDPEFGSVDPQVAINQAITGPSGPGSNAKTQPVATVAMVYDPTIAIASRRVKFMVYDGAEILSDFAALDNGGVFALKDALAGDHFEQSANITVPDNCLTCHGVGATYNRSESGDSWVEGAAFLPFDPEALIFSTSSSTYSKANMMPQIKALNALVWDTAPPAQVTALLQGMYPVNGTPTGPKDASSVFDPTYIPAAWKTADKVANQVYTEVVKPYCRTCHVTAYAGLDWDSYSEFQTASPSIAGDLCTSGNLLPMPQAEQIQRRFWKSPARAHFVEAFDVSGACAP